MVPEHFRTAAWFPAVWIAGRRPLLAQARIQSPAEREAMRLLDEARGQLRSVQQNFLALVASMGQEAAREALEQGNLSIEVYEEQLRNARALA